MASSGVKKPAVMRSILPRRMVMGATERRRARLLSEIAHEMRRQFEEIVVAALGEPVGGRLDGVQWAQQEPGQHDGREDGRGRADPQADVSGSIRRCPGPLISSLAAVTAPSVTSRTMTWESTGRLRRDRRACRRRSRARQVGRDAGSVGPPRVRRRRSPRLTRTGVAAGEVAFGAPRSGAARRVPGKGPGSGRPVGAVGRPRSTPNCRATVGRLGPINAAVADARGADKACRQHREQNC